MNEPDELIDLITGRLSSSEKMPLIEKIQREPDTKKRYSELKATWAFMQSERRMPKSRQEASYKHIKFQLKKSETYKTIKIWSSVAAVIVLFLGLSAGMFYLGRNNAVSDKNLFVTTVEAPNGQISRIVLPDSTVVWLNSGTQLKYDNQFAVTNRNLGVSGQAYLEVKRNENLPLFVSTAKLDVKVLGTKFDVCAYPDENKVQVVLKSGKVELFDRRTNELMHRLKPGQMVSYDVNQRELTVQTVEPETYISWKEGDMVFKDTPMAEVIKRLERRYDVVVKVKDDKVYRSVLTGNFRNTSLNDMLEYIQFTSQVTFCINNNHTLSPQEIILKSR